MAKFSDWTKERNLFLEREDDIPPVPEAAPQEDMAQVRGKIDNLLKNGFAKMKSDFAKTFGQNIASQLAQTKSVAVNYLKKALLNLSGSTDTKVEESANGYYEASFNKLGRMFSEVETIATPSAVATPVDNASKTTGITNYLDIMRSQIMQHIDRILTSMHHDKIHQTLGDLHNKLDANHKSTNDMIHSVKGHVTNKFKLHSPLSPEPEAPETFVKEKDVAKKFRGGLFDLGQTGLQPKPQGN